MKGKPARYFRYLMIGLALVTAALFILPQVWRVGEVSGWVTTGGRPVQGAVVRVKATGFETRSDSEGRFTLGGFPPRFSVKVTAWAEGFYIGGDSARPWKRDVEISLKPYLTADNPDYRWIPPAVKDRPPVEDFLIRTGLSAAAKLSFNKVFLPLASRLEVGCADCHGRTINEQWEGGAHAQGTGNIRFKTMYDGTDVEGNQSPPTRQGFHRDYGRFPLPPDPNKPYYGPGFKLDFPDQAGHCATCHAPTAALDDPYNTDINGVQGIDAQGIQCDYCHKVEDVRVNPATQLPYEDMPGILSTEMRRPEGEPQLFFGPFDDVDVGPDTYSPLQKESRFCASCHNASFWGTPIYQSYAEWLESPYPGMGKTCQSCHMQPDGTTTNFAPGRGGLERDPDTIATHGFPGAADPELLRNAVTMTVEGARRDGRVQVTVTIANDRTGHHVPTDSPLRHMILLVKATGADGSPLRLLDGPRVPAWGGEGIPARGHYAGLPGTAYAKILEELWTEVSPSGAYWNPTRIAVDNRIPAMGSDTSVYSFAAPAEAGTGTGTIRVEATLLFRRAFIQLAEQKGWEIPDIVMAGSTLSLVGER
ncbi:MAG: carboxypeptidase regulatory-like domain-containing protein [Firmicutes bacterium]|nr:carboxypeptidase regulatory-like domain-containing protein [Bacillota bacterium]